MWENSSKINKHGGSNKACSWDFFLKKNKKNSMLIRDFRVDLLKTHYCGLPDDCLATA